MCVRRWKTRLPGKRERLIERQIRTVVRIRSVASLEVSEVLVWFILSSRCTRSPLCDNRDAAGQSLQEVHQGY